MVDLVYIYTDGACSGNPGPGGWAALLRYKTKEKLLSGATANTTNNRMELQAAIEGLKALTRTSKVQLVTDSKYVKDGITTWIKSWEKKGEFTKTNSKIKNLDLWQELNTLNNKHDVHWQWVRGHSGHEENEIVDQAAREAIKTL